MVPQMARDGNVNETARPVPLPVIVDHIPPQLQSLKQWVVWRFVPDGEGGWDKPPLKALAPQGQALASSTDPKTWSTFEAATAAYKGGGLDGIGFVLRDNGIVGIDLDKCREPESGTIDEWALDIIKTLDTYSEVSPSGRGIRMFLFGQLPPAGRKKGQYENYQTGRYVTVTGQCVEGAPTTIEHRQAQLEAVHRQAFGEARPTTSTPSGGGVPTNLDDAEIVRLASEAKGTGPRFRKLWNGDTSGHGGDHSRADLALCSYLAFWCGPDEARISELFRQSALFRSKWNRDDYRSRTIAKALEGRTEFYEPSRKAGKLCNGHIGNNGTAAPDPLGYHLTDVGNARRVVQRHGKDLRFCHAWKQWFIWDGRRWAADETAEAVRRVKETQAALYRWAAEKLAELSKQGEGGDEDDERSKQIKKLTKLLNHCLEWEDARDIARCLQLATSEPAIPVVPAQLDADPFLLNCLNGTLDLRTGGLREHRREDYLTKISPVEYRADATCPLWDGFLRRILDENTDLIGYLQRVVGYSLTGDVREQSLWFLHGSGANGKSTFLTAVLSIMGDYGIQAVSDLLLAKKNESHPTERADLFGRRFVATIEVDNGRHMAEALMKQLTGGDKVRARRMRQDFFEFMPTWKIFLAANHKPMIHGTDHAAWRRIKLVPFALTIPPEDQDKTLPQKLLAERPGILAWAVRGCLGWQRGGLGEPEEVKIATDAYRAEQDTLATFIAACCFASSHARVRASALHESYERWSGDKVSAKTFTTMMEEKGYPSKRGGHGGYAFYHGIGLPTPEEGHGDGW
jgi:putative DNA primase/helicase